MCVTYDNTASGCSAASPVQTRNFCNIVLLKNVFHSPKIYIFVRFFLCWPSTFGNISNYSPPPSPAVNYGAATASNSTWFHPAFFFSSRTLASRVFVCVCVPLLNFTTPCFQNDTHRRPQNGKIFILFLFFLSFHILNIPAIYFYIPIIFIMSKKFFFEDF